MNARKVLIFVILASVAVSVVIIAVVFTGGKPARPLPNPNGYDDFVKAGQMVTPNVINFGEMTKEELVFLVATNSEALQLLRSGLSRECRQPDFFSASPSNIDLGLRAEFSGYLFCANGRRAELNGKIDEAVTNYLDAIRYAQEFSHGANITGRILCVTVEHVATPHLLSVLRSIDATECRKVAETLETLDAEEDPAQVTLELDKRYVKHAFGFRGQLEEIIEYRTVKKTNEQAINTFQKCSLLRRQAMIAFAARAYELEKGKAPTNITDLVPDYLKAVPKDPLTGEDMGLGH